MKKDYHKNKKDCELFHGNLDHFQSIRKDPLPVKVKLSQILRPNYKGLLKLAIRN